MPKQPPIIINESNARRESDWLVVDKIDHDGG
jgi:hypothetical protein